MTLSKDRLRKIHGVAESTGPADQAVLTRRKYHEAAAQWLARRSFLLQATFAAIGFVVVMLPMFSKTWRTIIESTPVVRSVFHDYSTFSGLAMVNLYILMALFLVRSWQIKSLPGGAAIALTYRTVLDMELFPRTRREEFAYWTDISFGFLSTTLWLFLPFGVIAYFINIGG
jgi:hypothetical protein